MKMKKIKSLLELTLSLATAEFKLRNEGSYLGIFWYLLNPLFMFFLLLLVFSDRVGTNIPNYPIYLLLGIIMFNFFQRATFESTKAIVDNKGIIKSINFPREALISSVILKTFFSHIFEIILFLIFLLFFKIQIGGVLFVYPIILIFFCIFIFGASLILSAIAIYFIDLENIWSFVSRLIWLGTPIFYAIGGQNRLFYVSLFNPMYYFITMARDAVIYTKMPQLWMITGAIAYSLLSLIIGLGIFKKLKVKFAEMI
jgi:lipopolysaccharide transport system permease protein